MILPQRLTYSLIGISNAAHAKFTQGLFERILETPQVVEKNGGQGRNRTTHIETLCQAISTTYFRAGQAALQSATQQTKLPDPSAGRRDAAECFEV
jgi:hypothetical protein